MYIPIFQGLYYLKARPAGAMSAPIKTEGGGKKPMFKPKFVPKVPVKTESTSEGAAQYVLLLLLILVVLFIILIIMNEAVRQNFD